MGRECGLRAWAWGRGKRGPDASLAALAGLAVESWSATRAAASLLLWDGMGVGLPVSQWNSRNSTRASSAGAERSGTRTVCSARASRTGALPPEPPGAVPTVILGLLGRVDLISKP